MHPTGKIFGIGEGQNMLKKWFHSKQDILHFFKMFEAMKVEFTAVIEKTPEGGYWAFCPEISGANGQGESVEEARESLKEAIIFILED